MEYESLINALHKTSFPSSFVELAHALNGQFSWDASSGEIMHGVGVHLKRFGSSGINQIVSECLKNSVWLQELANSSYLHKNGFYKINLLTNERYTLRLHIWLPGEESMETLHNHRWYIASHVIAGELKSEIWEDSMSPKAKYYDEYLYLDKNTTPKYLGKARVRCVGTKVQKQGESYVLEPNTLHRIVQEGNEMVATLMCRCSSVRGWARNVIVNEKIPDVRPQYLSTNQLSEVFRLYLDYYQCSQEES